MYFFRKEHQQMKEVVWDGVTDEIFGDFLVSLVLGDEPAAIIMGNAAAHCAVSLSIKLNGLHSDVLHTTDTLDERNVDFCLFKQCFPINNFKTKFVYIECNLSQ